MPENLVTSKNIGEFLFYQTEDGLTRIDVKVVDKNIWLSLSQIADLFQLNKSTISRHIKNIFEEDELVKESVVANFAITSSDGKVYQVKHYNLDAIIAVGYRVQSHRGIQFRTWATQRLNEYIIKGFTLDDERLKQEGNTHYFDELLARIRDIRSSEKIFWRKVLDIYATSIDYDPRTDVSQAFFATIQNKMHWAAHGHTAAEIIYKRADATQPYMGLKSFSGKTPKLAEVGVAKNYLNEKELDMLNRIVSLYLDFAELQAKNKRAMYMKDWITRLDDLLRLSEHDILTHAGKISHKLAKQYAQKEYDRYQQQQLKEKTAVEKDFEKSLKHLENVEKLSKREIKSHG